MADIYSIAGFPRVIGAIDGSLVAIRGPDEEEHFYVCHKGFHAMWWQYAMHNCRLQM